MVAVRRAAKRIPRTLVKKNPARSTAKQQAWGAVTPEISGRMEKKPREADEATDGFVLDCPVENSQSCLGLIGDMHGPVCITKRETNYRRSKNT